VKKLLFYNIDEGDKGDKVEENEYLEEDYRNESEK
jgi:hypothetical protein